jgi:hypothetical protein
MKYHLKYLLFLVSATAIVGLNSCQKKIDEAFANPNALIKQPIESLLPGVIANMVVSHSANGTLYGTQRDGQYIAKFIQNFATNTTLNRQDMHGDWYGTSTPDLMGDIWAMHYYGHGQNIERIIEWGTEEEKWDYVGVAKAIRAWGWLTLTDVTDDVILYEAFDPGQLVFNYNTQAEVYEVVKSLCHEAIAYLSRTDGKVSPANLAIGDAYMNGGDVEKWKKFVYGVLARTFHRTTNKTSYDADSVIKYCDLAMQTNAENSRITWSNAGGSGTFNWYSPFRGNAGTFRQTRFIADLMRGVNAQFPTGDVDPRAPYIIRENPNGTYRGILPVKGGGSAGLTLGDSSHNFWGGLFQSTAAPSNDNNSRYIFKNAALWPIITAYEIQFIKAEALLEKGDKPNALLAYVKALNLHFDHLVSDYEVSVPPALKMTPGTRAAYLSNPLVVPTAANLTRSHILMQKYIAMYIWGAVETWVDMRRFHYTDPDPETGFQVYRDFVLPAPTDIYSGNLGKPIYRERPRYNSEYLYNQAELNRLGAFANDYITKEMWFSKP